MSYDLYFYKRKKSSLSEADFAAHLTANLKFTTTDNPKQWYYENPQTAVNFWIDWNEPNTAQEDIDIFDKFKDFESLNFCFGINFIRPRFYAFEVFPIIERLIIENDLYVLDPQDEIDPDAPRKFETGYLRDQWIRHNDKVCAQHFDEFKLEYMSPDKSDQMWWFLFNREEIQNSLIEDIFVTGHLLIKSNEDGKVYTVCVWPDHIPIIIPPLDYVIVRKKIKTLFSTREESGLVSYSVIMEQFGGYFESFDHEIPDLKVLRQENADRISKEFNKLKVVPVKDFGTGVSFDRISNVLP